MESEFKKISATNFNKISNSVSKIGYVEGITAGKESVFQSGFDQGYADGLRTGFEIAKYRTLAMKDNTDQSTLDINLPPATDRHNFQMPKHINKTVSEISKLQNDYVDNLVKNFKINFPKS